MRHEQVVRQKQRPAPRVSLQCEMSGERLRLIRPGWVPPGAATEDDVHRQDQQRCHDADHDSQAIRENARCQNGDVRLQ